MGLNASYYIVDESELVNFFSEDADIESLRMTVSQIHEYHGKWFWRNRYGHGIKAWNPLFALVGIFDRSADKVCIKLLNSKQGISSFDTQMVKAIFYELKKISIDDIENAVDNLELTNEIESMPGYNMKSITYKESMVIEFMELLKAFYEAHKLNKAMIIIID